MTHERPLPDEVLLLAIDDDGKYLVDQNKLRVALAASAVLELHLIGVLETDEGGKRDRLRRTDVGVPGDDELWAEIAEKADDKTPKGAVSALVSNPFHNLGTKVEEQSLDKLVADGVLEKHEGRTLGVFPTKRWRTADASDEASVHATVQAALATQQDPDVRTGALISVLWSIGIVKEVFAGEAAERRAEEISEGNWAAAATKGVVAGMTAAVIAGAVVGGGIIGS